LSQVADWGIVCLVMSSGFDPERFSPNYVDTVDKTESYIVVGLSAEALTAALGNIATPHYIVPHVPLPLETSVGLEPATSDLQEPQE
jgi:hypothetical protein